MPGCVAAWISVLLMVVGVTLLLLPLLALTAPRGYRIRALRAKPLRGLAVALAGLVLLASASVLYAAAA